MTDNNNNNIYINLQFSVYSDSV